MFKCAICNYNTNVKCNYIKHLKTKKHINNMKNHNDYQGTNNTIINTVKMTQNDPIMTQNDPTMTQNDPIKLCDLNHSKLFFCRFCNRQFSTKAHMRRHELHRCKNNNLKIKNLIEQHDK